MRISDWSSDVCSSDLLWWRTRKSFRLRLWPKRMSRPAIVTHHRDLGIVVAPLLLLSLVTGTMMIFRPFAIAFVAPFGSVPETVKSMEPPQHESAPHAATPASAPKFNAARRRFPAADFSIPTHHRHP